MFEDPEQNPEETPVEKTATPALRAKERADEFRIHAELAAVFEGVRKFDAQILPRLNADIARDIQKTMASLERHRADQTPLIEVKSFLQAASLLDLPANQGLGTNDYHIYRRPGEVMILRWLAGEEVETYYQRLQAHFDAAHNHYRVEERASQGWKQDADTLAYLDALDANAFNMAEKYLREPIREHKLFVLSTQTADEMDILHLTDTIMGISPESLVGPNSAPPEAPTEQDRAWFFKLFSLRGMKEDVEQMCFFTYMQKTEEGW